MSDTNQTTLQSYDEHIDDYVQGTVQTVVDGTDQWIDENLAGIDKHSLILELGSGFGREAAYIESKGYKIQRTDGSKGFVNYLQAHGHQAKLLNAITDTIPSDLSMVFANAVLLHFTPEEVKQVMRKVFAALRPGGRFVFSLKEGDGEEWENNKLGAPRYFHYWQVADVEELLRKTGFVTITCSPGRPSWATGHSFLLFTAIKEAE